jgi:predicted nucleic acid-binding protein
MKHVVIDTNVMVSAYLGGSLEAIIVAWRAGKFALIVSNQVVNEYLDVLSRPKFKIAHDELDDFAALMLSEASILSHRGIRWSAFGIIKWRMILRELSARLRWRLASNDTLGENQSS